MGPAVFRFTLEGASWLFSSADVQPDVISKWKWKSQGCYDDAMAALVVTVGL